MKLFLVYAFIFCSLTKPSAQNTIAKFKYEEAEKSYSEGHYQDCLNHLIEAEKTIGQTPPNVLHLKILAQHKLLETNTSNKSFEAIKVLQENCTYYLLNYEINGLEDKYRDVYDINNYLKTLAQNEQEFNKTLLETKTQIIKTLKNYINAIGGENAIKNVNSIYQKGQKTIDGAVTLYFDSKKLGNHQSETLYFNSKKREKDFAFKVLNSTGLVYGIDKNGSKKIMDANAQEPTKYLIRELDWLDYINDSTYEFSYENNIKSILITLNFFKAKQGTSILREYDLVSHYVKREVVTTYVLNTNNTKEIKTTTETIFENFKPIENLILPYKKSIVFSTFGGLESKNEIKSFDYIIEEIQFNSGVSLSDFQ